MLFIVVFDCYLMVNEDEYKPQRLRPARHRLSSAKLSRFWCAHIPTMLSGGATHLATRLLGIYVSSTGL